MLLTGKVTAGFPVLYCFTKEGMDSEIEHGIWQPEVVECFERDTANGFTLLLQQALPSVAAERFGAPAALTTQISLSHVKPEITIQVQWFEKPACRLPAACWFEFAPVVDDPQNWQVHKLGEWLSPLDVVAQGGSMMHGVDSGVRCKEDGGSLVIESLDAAVVAVVDSVDIDE